MVALDATEEKRRESNGEDGSSLEMSKRTKYTCMAILFCVNLLNYMDRYTIAGVLSHVQKFYDINDSEAGFLQTVFIIAFMIFSPLFGYLGDRHNRKAIIIVGIAVWVASVFASTFVPSDHFWLFMLLRGVVGVGEATYAVVTPSIISDMFSGAMRSRMLMIFYFAIPIGSGLGFVVGSQIQALTGQWQWGVRFSAIFGIISEVAIILFLREPERGAAESAQKSAAVGHYKDDIKALVRNKTYVLSTIGYTAIIFTVGTLSWWVPTAIQLKDGFVENLASTSDISDQSKANFGLFISVSMIFGVILCVGGLVGVAMGSGLSALIGRLFHTRRSDAIVCALGAAIGLPTLIASMRLMTVNMAAAWVVLFICVTALCFNWAINVDMQLSIVTPYRRNTANSWQILISHLFGDASGPYLIGGISDLLRHGSDAPKDRYESLVTSFYLPTVIVAVSAVFYSIAAFTITRDQERMRADMAIEKSHDQMEMKHEGLSPNKDSISDEKGKSNLAFQMDAGSKDQLQSNNNDSTSRSA